MLGKRNGFGGVVQLFLPFGDKQRAKDNIIVASWADWNGEELLWLQTGAFLHHRDGRTVNE